MNRMKGKKEKKTKKKTPKIGKENERWIIHQIKLRNTYKKENG